MSELKNSYQKARLHHLQKVLAVQTDYLSNQFEGVPKIFIFRKFIRDKYFISERTFWRYLDTNARKEIRQLKTKLGLPVEIKN